MLSCLPDGVSAGVMVADGSEVYLLQECAGVLRHDGVCCEVCCCVQKLEGSWSD